MAERLVPVVLLAPYRDGQRQLNRLERVGLPPARAEDLIAAGLAVLDAEAEVKAPDAPPVHRMATHSTRKGGLS